MKILSKAIGLGVTIVGTFIISTFLGYKLGNILIGIIVGFVLNMFYLISIVVIKK